MTNNNTLRLFFLPAALAIVIATATACGSSSPMEPQANQPADLSISAVSAVEADGNHSILGVWDFVIEPGVGIVDAVPSRTLEAHYNITQIALSAKSCPGCLTFQFGNIGNGGQQNVVVTLNNKYVGKIPGYDLKGIILADRSVDPTAPYKSPWYLLNTDDNTNLGKMPISGSTRNPFKAFCPNDPQRKLAVGQTSTLTFKLMFPPAPVDWSKITVGWALDACESNCPEPYAIENQAIAGGIIPILGETAQVSLNARDHQSNTATVSINASSIGGGTVALTNGNGDAWSGKLAAGDNTAPGKYKLEITATDSIEKQVKIFDDLTATVGLSNTQSAIYTKLAGIVEDWDADQFDCFLDELADALDTDSNTIKDPIQDYMNDLISLMNGSDTGDTLKWKALKLTKDLVKDLADLGIDTTMSDLVDAMRDALDACLNGHQGWGKTKHNINAGSCTLDIGVIGGGALQGHVLYTGNSPNCNQVWKYTPDYAGSGLYKSLINLDPANLGFQPWPVVRIDATDDGAFSWTNSNYDYYQASQYNNIPIRISSIWCTDDNVPSFHAIPVDDSRIFPVPPPPPMSQFTPADVCDDFDKLQYALVVDPTMIFPPHVWGIKGAPQGKDYTKSDDRYGAFFPAANVGPGDGQIEAGLGDIAGIDVWNKTASKVWLYVAENGGQWAVEVFEINDVGGGLGLDTLAPVYTIHFNTRPLDVELIPVNSEYELNPTVPTIAVLLRSNDGTGYISLHRADNGTLLETIGTAQTGYFDVQPSYLDVNDGNGDIHVTEPGPAVTIFNLTNIPG